jgi:hypothetical protein
MEIDGPIDGPIGLVSTFFAPAEVGYVAEEFFLSGTATAYRPAGDAGDDGRWPVESAGTAPYRTRLVVYRPADPAAFRGTAVVEWLNVSSGADAPACWLLSHRHLLRSGWAWVGVTAQRAGVDGGSIFQDEAAQDADWRSIILPPLKKSDPERYGSLDHPGDAYSYDIFAQAGRAVRERLGADRLLAAGQSQSAAALVTHVNVAAPRDGVYDGYLIDGRPGAAAGLDGFPEGDLRGAVRIRPDTAVPVLVVQTETDVFGVLHSLPARQPDGERIRLWEIAGTAHCDSYLIGAAFTDSGALPAAELARLMTPRRDPLGVPFAAPINSAPQHHYVAQAALAALDRWVAGGTPPPVADRLAVGPDGAPVPDRHGIMRGGVRTGWVDVPVAVLSGLGQGDTGPGVIFGSTRPLAEAVLAELYPGGRDDYLARFAAATDRTITAGFLLAADRDEILALAAAAFPTG